MAPEAARANAALISSAVASVSNSATKSTTETSGVGTRIAIPSSLPSTSGITSAVARAAPVVVGIMDMAAARARLMSLWGMSSITWSLVYEWIVVISPRRNPNPSRSTFTTGARQFVVQLALEMMW